jgi:hypothetical protein
MSEHPHRPGEVHTSDAAQYDRDLNVRGVVWSALILAAGTLLVLLLVWWLFLGLGRLGKASDPPAPALRQVRERRLPPEPRLQMIARPSWIDQKQGTVRIPVDLAIDVLVRRGLPAANGNPSATPGALATPAPPVPTPVTTAPNPASPQAGDAQ